MAQALDRHQQVKPSNESDAEQIRAMIEGAQRFPAPEERFKFLANQFIERATPYSREMLMPDLPVGVMRVDLSSFDCASFVHFLIALTCARDFETFLWILKTIRYLRGCVSPNNLLHFLNNNMSQMIEAQIVVDLTSELAPPNTIRTRTVKLGIKCDGEPFYELHRRNELWDAHGHFIGGDRNLGQVATMDYICRSGVAELEPLLKCGDVLYLVDAQDPQEYPELFTHSALVYKFDDCPEKAFLLHSSQTEWSVIREEEGGVCIAMFPRWTREARLSINRYCQLHEYLEAYRRRFDGLVLLRLNAAHRGAGGCL